MTQRHCRACNGWHDLDEVWPAECSGHFRSHRGPASDLITAPVVIRDCIEMRSMADGQMYTSKRAYYSSLRSKDLEIVEKPVLTEGPNRPELKMPRAGHDVKRAMES
jgi:hypothetical protein